MQKIFWWLKENAKINIFNSLKVKNLAWELWNNMLKYWFKIPEQNSIWNTPEELEKTTIYYNGISKNSDTIKALKTFFNWEFIETELPKYSKRRRKYRNSYMKRLCMNRRNFKILKIKKWI